LDRLEPLTKRYYDSFFECPECNRIFWPGSDGREDPGQLPPGCAQGQEGADQEI